MISSKADYRRYYLHDLKQTGLSVDTPFIRKIFDRRYRFYKSLRRSEYYLNCRRDLFGRLIGKLYRARHELLCNKYQWTIPLNVFKEGLSIVHVGPIVVSGSAQIGKNCRIHVGVNIGHTYTKGRPWESGAPQLGDNIYIAPGAKLFGNIVIGDNTAIGANAVVNDSFPEGNCTIAGIPARKISERTSLLFINHD